MKGSPVVLLSDGLLFIQSHRGGRALVVEVRPDELTLDPVCASILVTPKS